MSIRHFARLRVFALFSAFAVVLSACGSDPATPTTPAICTVSNVDLSAPVRTIFPGGSTTLQATATHANCATAPAITFTTSASNIATVTSTGTVTGVVPGDFVITAASGGRTATVNMTVAPAPVNTIEVNAGAGSVIVGQTLALVATTKDAQGATLTGRTVTWSSAAASVASVSASGVVTGVAAGSAMVTATSEGKSTTVSITVSPVPVSTVVVTVPSLTMVPNSSQQATAVARDASGNVIVGRAVIWSSSNPTVGIVSSSGVVGSVAPGVVIITATIEGRTATVSITVSPVPVSTVVVTVPSLTMAINTSQQATAVARDASGNVIVGRAVVWSSSNATVGIVSSSGLVGSVAPGVVTITATIDGTAATVSITVSPGPVSTVAITVPNLVMALNTFQQATAEARDAWGNVIVGRAVAWSSSNPAVGIVSSSGLIGSVAPGTVNIAATIDGRVAVVLITVSPVPVSTVVVTVPSLTMAINTSQQATAVARDPSGTVLTGRAITWSTSNAAVGIVTSSGLVTSIGPGAVAITATIGGTSGLVAIAVPAPPAPTVSAVAPLTVDAVFLTVPIAITGTNFQTGATSVAFTGTGITSGALAVNSSTSMTVPLFIASGTTATPSDVTVTTFGGTSAVRQLNVFAVGSAPVVGAPVVGGPGGATAYTVDCPAGSVATGANARVGAFMDNFQLRCQTVTGANRTFGAVVPSNLVGGNGGTPWVLACNAGSVMTGISGSYTSAIDPDIVTIRAICSPIDGGATQVTTTAGGAPGAGTFSSSCPLGLVMVGMQGAYGALVDRVQPRCR